MREKKTQASRHSKVRGMAGKGEDTAKTDQGDLEKLLRTLRGRYKGDRLVDALHSERRRDDEITLKKHQE